MEKKSFVNDVYNIKSLCLKSISLFLTKIKVRGSIYEVLYLFKKKMIDAEKMGEVEYFLDRDNAMRHIVCYDTVRHKIIYEMNQSNINKRSEQWLKIKKQKKKKR